MGVGWGWLSTFHRVFLHPCLWFALSRWDRVPSALGGPEAMAKLQVRAGGTGWVRGQGPEFPVSGAAPKPPDGRHPSFHQR